MKMEFNKVTWYSKLLALVIFITLPFVGFYLGVKYEELKNSVRVNDAASSVFLNENDNALRWVNYKSNDGSFTIRYPFYLYEEHELKPSINWRLGSQKTGQSFLNVIIGRLFESNINFIEGQVRVGASRDGEEIKNCQNAGVGEYKIGNRIIDGANFSLFQQSTGAAAGNYFSNKSYRLVRNGAYYAIDMTVHSANIQNYPETFSVVPFNEEMVWNFMYVIVSTFEFSR